MVYTFKSLKRFHSTYQNTRKYTGITDPVGCVFFSPFSFCHVLVHLREKGSSSLNHGIARSHDSVQRFGL